MTSGVYAIVNVVTGVAYVGSSKNIEARWQYRRSALRCGRSDNKALQADWTAVRGKGFRLRILEQIDDANALTAAEQHWLDQYEGHCYNVRMRVWRACNANADCPCWGCRARGRRPQSPSTSEPGGEV